MHIRQLKLLASIPLHNPESEDFLELILILLALKICIIMISCIVESLIPFYRHDLTFLIFGRIMCL
jgi:hypothetical protein